MNVADLQALLKKASGTLPIIHQNHWIKAAMGLYRLQNFLPQQDQTFWLNIVKKTAWEEQPSISVQIASSIDWNEYPGEQRVLRELQRAVAPSYYSSGAKWIRKVGFEASLEKFRDEIAHSPGYLGHALSVALGFREAWPNVQAQDFEAIFLERYLEFISSSLFKRIQIDFTMIEVPLEVSFHEVLNLSLNRPSFLGHHIIALAYLERNKDWLAELYLPCLRSLYAHILKVYPDPEDNVEISDISRDSCEIQEALIEFLTHGPNDVHLVTLADSVAWLSTKAKASQLCGLNAVLKYFTVI